MATPLRTTKLYPDLPAPSPLVGLKRKAGSGVFVSEGKENNGSLVTKKKQKITPDNPEIKKLQEIIDKECMIRDGASKLLHLAKTTRQNMEASKSLFVSNMKILELMKKLQHIQQEQKESIPIEIHDEVTEDTEVLSPCKAKFAISDIRIPLEWKEFEQIKGKIDSSYKVGVFCLFRLGNQVMDTPTLVEVDRSMVDISFPDMILFPDKIDADFTLIVEVYCSVPASDSSVSSTVTSSTPAGKESTPMKMFRKIKKELSHDHLVGSPLSSSSSTLSLSPYVAPMPTANPTYNFALAGHTQLTFKDVMGTCRTYGLTKGAIGSSGTALSSSAGDQPLLPLWGQICCTLMAEPTSATQPRSTGFINVQQMVSGYPAWLRQWCILRQHHLRCWTYPEDVGRKMPVNTIDLTKEMTVENAPRLTMRRPNTLLIKDHETDQELYLSFESKEERDQWATLLRQAILDLKIWKDSSNFIMPKQSSKFYSNDNNFESPYKRNNAFSQYTPPTETVL